MMHGSYKVYKLQSFEITWRLEFLISLTENDSGYELYSYFKLFTREDCDRWKSG